MAAAIAGLAIIIVAGCALLKLVTNGSMIVFVSRASIIAGCSIDINIKVLPRLGQAVGWRWGVGLASFAVDAESIKRRDAMRALLVR